MLHVIIYIKHAEVMRVGSTHIRGMKDPVKREDIILQM